MTHYMYENIPFFSQLTAEAELLMQNVCSNVARKS